MSQTPDIQRRTNPFARTGRTFEQSEAEALVVQPVAEPVVHTGDEFRGVAVELEVECLELRPVRLLTRELRPMSGHEEQLVEERAARTAGSLDNVAELCNELLARCLVPPGQDPGQARARVNELCVGERDLALVVLRRLSFGDKVEMLIDCPTCGEVNETGFNLAELALELDPIPTRLRVRVGEFDEAELRPPNAADQAELFALGLESLAHRRSWLLARVLLRLGARPAPFTREQIHDLPVALRRGLERGLERVPDLELGLDVRCHACTHEFQSPFELESFFLPS